MTTRQADVNRFKIAPRVIVSNSAPKSKTIPLEILDGIFVGFATPKEHLLVSKVLPVLWAPYYFCAYSDLSLLYEIYGFSSHAEC